MHAMPPVPVQPPMPERMRPMLHCTDELHRRRDPGRDRTLTWMGKQEERELLREIIPDSKPKKIDAAQHMLAWRCSQCGYVTNGKVPIKVPAPCVQCGGTSFRVVNH